MNQSPWGIDRTRVHFDTVAGDWLISNDMSDVAGIARGPIESRSSRVRCLLNEEGITFSNGSSTWCKSDGLKRYA